MSEQPNYKLKDYHAVTAGHMRTERLRNDTVYATKDQIDGIQSDRIVSSSNPNNGLVITDPQTCTATVDIDLGQTHEIYKLRPAPAQYGISLISRNDGDARYVQKDENTLDNVLPPGDNVDMNQKKIINMAQGTLSSDAVTKAQLDQKKDTGTFDTKIQNATAKTAISCDGDRYISIKSNNVKIADILEDEQNQGFTLLTNNKRLNLVSTQPQTFYHNSGASLYNFKYTDDGNVVAGQARFGQIQLAPSNTTNLNPALTLSSSRVNGLGTAGSIYLDSSYGQSGTPLILSAQSLTDASANQLQMFRSTAAPAIKNQFTAKTGYASDVAITEPQQFTNKTYTDNAVAAKLDISGGTMTGHINLVGQPELSTHAVNRDYVDQVENSLVKKSGSTMTGPLVLSGLPTLSTHAASRQYVDNQIAAIEAGGPQQTPSELVDAGATDGNIYRLKVANDQLELYRADTDNFLNVYGSSTAVVYDSLKTNMFMECASTDVAEINWYRRARFGTLSAIRIPQFRIEQKEVDPSGEQYTRLSSTNTVTGGASNTSIYMYPDTNANVLLKNKITVNRRIGYETSVDNTTADLTDLSLVSKGQADALYVAKTGGSVTSLTNGSNIVMSAQPTDIIVEDLNDQENGYLVLTNRSVRNDNGTSLFLARGDSSLVIIDDGTLASRTIKANVPFSYEEGSIGAVQNDNEIQSRLMCDERYVRQQQDIDMQQAYRINNLLKALNQYEPVRLREFVDELQNYQQTIGFEIKLGDVPSTVDAVLSTNNCVTSVVYTNTSSNTGYYTVNVDWPKIYGGQHYYVQLQWYSSRSGISIDDSSVFTPIVSNYFGTSFTIYVRENASLTQSLSLQGTFFRRNFGL